VQHIPDQNQGTIFGVVMRLFQQFSELVEATVYVTNNENTGFDIVWPQDDMRNSWRWHNPVVVAYGRRHRSIHVVARNSDEALIVFHLLNVHHIQVLKVDVGNKLEY
jgi:hypothetical protein